MNERNGFFDRRPSPDGEAVDQQAANSTHTREARAASPDVSDAAVRGQAPVAGSPAVRAGTPLLAVASGGDGTSAAELEREARRLEQAAVDAADVVRRAVADGRRLRLGELQRNADRLYDRALHARLRADEAMARCEDTSAAGPHSGLDGDDIPVITWNRPELDWTSLVAAAIDKTDEAADQAAQRKSAAADLGANGGRVSHARSPSPPSTR